MKHFMNNNPYKCIIIEGECRRTKCHHSSYWPGKKYNYYTMSSFCLERL